MLSNSSLVRVYIGLGSNLVSPITQVKRAIAELAQLPASQLVAVSKLYRSSPMGPSDQPDYINAVAAIDTRLAALELLDGLQAIENAHQRRRGSEQWGPRTLDLDLLLFGDEVINEPRLTVPHPGIAERSFVLQPLLDIDSSLRLPDGRAVQALCDRLPGDVLEVVRQGTSR